ncbi:MAG: hypothetical protein ABI852_16880, partial [Gemmatimonadaceae bacterium]
MKNYSPARQLSSPVPQRLWALLLLIATLVSSNSLSAQVDPRGKIRTLRTEHFRVHYDVKLDSVARRAAHIAEDAWTKLAKELVTPSVPIELLIQDNLDLSNGFATVFPSNRIVIYSVPPVETTELRFHDDWLRLVITHELTHIFHIDRSRGFWHGARLVLGREPLLFPNNLLPSWVKEGLAVHYETQITGGGRLNATDSRTVANAAALAGEIPGPDAWSASTTKYPRGGIPYAWGQLLMRREAQQGGDSSMRKFIEETALALPFTLNRSAKRAFGKTFFGSFAGLRDSLNKAQESAKFDDASWVAVEAGTEKGNWGAAYPRWRTADTLEWAASNGRQVAGFYRTTLPDSETIDHPRKPTRVARRNSLDVNAVGPNGTSVFSQYDYSGSYVLRSDLYRRDASGEHRLTHNARLIQPDVREKDGAIIAVQLYAGGSRLVRVNGGVVTPLSHDAASLWAEPRWDPTFETIAAVQLLRSGIERIVLLDTLGSIVRIVTESRGVLGSPTYVGNSGELMWASDRSGRMQLEIADISQAFSRSDLSKFADGVRTLRAQPFVDTLWRAQVRQASNVSTGIYQPSVSPDGLTVAALIYRVNGYVLSVGPLRRDGDPVRDTWYASTRFAPNNDSVFNGASASYHAVRQLIPKYWDPEIGQARDGGSSYGASTSGVDILGRHEYAAAVLVNPRDGETNGGVAYRYSGLGQPVVDLALSQDWDATLRVVDSTGSTRGFVNRRLQFASIALNFEQPHVRWTTTYGFGAQYERRNYSSAVDSVLGAANSSLRRGTRYPSLFVSGGFSNVARGARGISGEQGISAVANVSVRQREGVANSQSWRTVAVLRGFQALPLPGFARHVIAARVAGGITDTKAPSEFS